MKAKLIFILSALFFLMSLTQAKANSSNLVLQDEPYIDDIPFDTKSIAGAYLASHENKQNQVRLGEEAYVDDIPFNTALVAAIDKLNTVLDLASLRVRLDNAIYQLKIRELSNSLEGYIINLEARQQSGSSNLSIKHEPARLRVVIAE